MLDKMNNFQQILKDNFNSSGSDKSTSHNYEFGYSQILPQKIKSLLEVGIANYTSEMSSLHAWSSIYKDSKIYGADIILEKLINDKNIVSFYVDQSNDNSLNELIKNINKNIDVVIDDGSHVFSHALTTFNKLFPITNIIYCIEDVTKISNGWQQSVSDWENHLNTIDNIEFGVIDCNPGVNDDSIIVWIKRK